MAVHGSDCGRGAGLPEASGIDCAVARMRALGAGLPDGDGVAVFNRMYLAVTEEIRDRLAGSYFRDPPGMTELDVLFAGRYLTAVDDDLAGRPPVACWQPLFALRLHPGIRPLQFALAGLNAHIEHDLPLAVTEACRRLQCLPEDLAADYHRINDVLADLEARVREQLLPGPDPLDAADPLVHLVGAWSIERARDAAWASVLALWELQHLPAAFGVLAAALDDSVGMVSRCLLTPLGQVRGR